MRTRYFHFPRDRGCKRVIVFRDGKEPGLSFWSDGDKGLAWWLLEEVKTEGAKEITRIKALRIVKKLPE